MKLEFAANMAGTHDFPLVGHIDKEIADFARGRSEIRIAGSLHAHPLEQSHPAIHFQAKTRNVAFLTRRESFNQSPIDKRGQLYRRFGLPIHHDPLEEQRREFSLELVFEGKVGVERLAVFSMPQTGLRFARIVIAVVVEEDDLASDLVPQPPGGLHFRKQKSLGKNPAGLLAKADDGRGGHIDVDSA
ncbi:MAG: hypothetical protein ABSH08_08840 [Tepidisphaeraceae bacterium]